MIKKIFSHTAIYGLAPYVPQLANIFILPIITKDLTDLDFGVLGVVVAYTNLITVFSTLGLKVVLTNLFFKHHDRFKIFWRQIYGFLNVWVIVYGTLLSSLIYFIVPEEAAENRWSIVFLNTLPIFLFGPTQSLAVTLFQIREQPLPIGVRTAIFGLITVFLNLYTISHLKMGYMGWFWSTFISLMLSQASYWYPLTQNFKIKPIYKFKWRFIKSALKISLPTVPHYYSGYLLNNSDRMVMDFMGVTTGNIGKYNIAYKFGSYVQKIGLAFNKSMSPLLMKQYKKGEEELARKIVFLIQLLLLVGTFILSIWLKEIFEILINNETLAQMYPLGIIIIMGYNYRPMYNGYASKFFFYEKTDTLWRMTFVAGISNVIFNIIFIPIWGYQTAAYTTFLSLMYMGYSGYFSKIFKEINDLRYYPIYWLLGTIVLTVLAFLMKDLTAGNKILVAVVTTGISLIIIYWTGLSQIDEK